MVLIKIISVIAIIAGLVLPYGMKMYEWKRRGIFIAILGLVMFSVGSIIVKVGAQDVGVVITPSGVNPEAWTTGWHILYPWNNMELMDKTVWVYTCSANPQEGAKNGEDAIWSPTIDGIKMGFDVSVSWCIDPNEAPWIYSNVSENDDRRGGRYQWLEENIIRTKLRSALPLTTSKYTPVECYSTGRQAIQQQVFDIMTKECKGYRLIIKQVDMRNVYYNPEYEAAINKKKIEEQNTQTLKEVTKQKAELLIQATTLKDIAIQQAQGESEALKIKGQSISNNPKIIQLEWINKWNGELPKTMMGDTKGIIMNMNDK